MDKKEAYKIVFEDLKKVGLFCGVYDAKNGSETYMHGISSVMECIAGNISDEVLDEFNTMFIGNLIASEEKAKKQVSDAMCI